MKKTAIVGLGVDTSLFLPVNMMNREESIKNIYDFQPFTGKSPELSEQLFGRLRNGEIDAVTHYSNVYNVKKPDSNLIEKLQKISWNEKLLVFVGATIVGKGLQAIIVALPFILRKHPDTHFIIIGSGASRELFEALVYAISNKNETIVDNLVERGYDLDPVDLTGPWTDVKTFLSDTQNKNDLFKYGSTLSEHVHFLGRLDHNLLRYVFPCCDIGLFPSIVPEAYGNVVFESLSSGVLPMASYFSGLACSLDNLVPHLGEELVDRMKIPVDDDTRITGLIENLSYLLENEIGEKNSSKIRKIAMEVYDWKIRAEEMVIAYSNFKENYFDNQ